MPDRREIYRSPNGDSWFLGREPENGHAFIIHQPNAPSGGRLSHVELGEFLRSGNGPEQQALQACNRHPTSRPIKSEYKIVFRAAEICLHLRATSTRVIGAGRIRPTH